MLPDNIVRVLDLRQMIEPFFTNAELLTVKCRIATKEKYPLWTPLKRKETVCKARENLSRPVSCPQRRP
jgi:hypothetical protein